MATLEKLLYSVMCGTQDKSIKFSDLQKILNVLGFQCRIKGDHFIYWKSGVDEIINIQPDGETVVKALENAEGIIQEWIETAKEIGREIPQPKGKLMFA